MSGAGAGGTVVVSTIIPVYNGARSVARAVDSALAQHFEDQEIIVVDDGSTDSTGEVLARYGDRIRVISQANRGAAAARNAGIAVARGRYVALLDCDDRWLPEHLAMAVAALERTPGAALSFSDIQAVDGGGNVIPHASFDGANLTLARLLSWYDWVIYPSTVVMRRDAAEACGGFAAEFRFGAGYEDPYMWFRMREQGSFVQIKEPLVVYRYPDFAAVADKYGHNLRIYLRMLRERYGAISRPARSKARKFIAASLALKAFRQMEEGKYPGALTTWIRVLRWRPWFPIEDGNYRRLLRRKNLRRMKRLFAAVIPGVRKA